MRKLFCVETDEYDISEVAKQLDRDWRLKLTHNPSKVVHGALYGNHYPAGPKLSQEYNRGKYWCNESIGSGAHSCVVVVLYEKEELPTYHPETNPTGHATHLKPHPKLADIHSKIHESITTLGKRQGIRLHHHVVDEAFEQHLDSFLPRR